MYGWLAGTGWLVDRRRRRTVVRMGCGASAARIADGVVDAEMAEVATPQRAAAGVAATVTPVAADLSSSAMSGIQPAMSLASAASSDSSLPGQLLLGVAQQLPFVAPVAFLIGAVVGASQSAKTLKADAKAFGRVVVSVEACCEQAALEGSLTEKSGDALALLREALEAGLAHCQKLQKQAFAQGFLFSRSDAKRFSDIQDELQRAMQLLTMAASVSAHSIVAEKFEQGDMLADKLDELGGPEVVAQDPSKVEQARAFLDASDRLLLASIADVKNTVKEERKQLQDALETKLELQSKEMVSFSSKCHGMRMTT